jgi:hypothetical protein
MSMGITGITGIQQESATVQVTLIISVPLYRISLILSVAFVPPTVPPHHLGITDGYYFISVVSDCPDLINVSNLNLYRCLLYRKQVPAGVP